MKRPGFAVLSILLAIAILMMAAIGITGIFFPKERVITPSIQPVMTGQSSVPVTAEFPFREGTIIINLTVNGSVLDGARTADKSVTIIGNITDNDWIPRSYTAMVNDPAQEEMYASLISRFRDVRQSRNLDDDEYLELIAIYVQSLRYETIEENPAKFPVETVADGAGDCDDKSLLLAGLLSRERYAVALFSFVPENHMAVGVGSDEYRYRNTRYSFVETTNITYIGVPTERLGKDRVLQSEPLVIPIGDGKTLYTRGEQVRFIHETAENAEAAATALEAEVKERQESLLSRQNEIKNLESRMQTFHSQGDALQYNALVSPHNALVAEYNSDRETYTQVYRRYEAYVRVYNYILEHPYDRPGVYEYIRTNIPQ